MKTVSLQGLPAVRAYLLTAKAAVVDLLGVLMVLHPSRSWVVLLMDAYHSEVQIERGSLRPVETKFCLVVVDGTVLTTTATSQEVTTRVTTVPFGRAKRCSYVPSQAATRAYIVEAVRVSALYPCSFAVTARAYITASSATVHEGTGFRLARVISPT